MKDIKYLAITVLGLLALPAMADDNNPFEGWGFQHYDWQVVCDNTLTCRAAGYTSYDSLQSASILFTAQPKVAIPTAKLKVLPEVTKNRHRVALWINNKNYGYLQPSSDGDSYRLNAKQTKALINQARRNTKIEVRAGSDTWQISDKGMGAALLKLDEAQGRVGTSLALVSKNKRPRQTPKTARPKPIVRKAYFYSEQDNKTLSPKKQAYFTQNINNWVNIDAKQFVGNEAGMRECELINPKTDMYKDFAKYDTDTLAWEFTPIDEDHTLASHICWSAAYNRGYGYWLIDHNNLSNPQFITTIGNSYYNGEISALQKGRGLGDCWSNTVWTWDGNRFAKTDDSSYGLCRGFAGGAWQLPTYVADVIN